MDDHHHRSGWLKQANKGHKHGRHKSKSNLDEDNKGKILKGDSGNKKRAEASRMDRKNRAKQIRDRKRADVVAAHRRIGGATGAPQVVAIIPLCHDINVRGIRQLLQTASMEGAGEDIINTLRADLDVNGPVTCVIPRLKSRITFLEAPRDILSVLDTVKIADVVMFVLSSEESPDEFGELCLSCTKALGLPSIICAVQGLEALPAKRKLEVKKALLKYLTFNFPKEEKVYGADTEMDGSLLLRQIANKKRDASTWRENHPLVLADKVEFIPGPLGKNSLAVTGFIRGANLNSNWLVHVPNVGDFQVEKIVQANDPYQLVQKKAKAVDSEMQDDGEVILGQPNPEEQETLQCELEPDMLEGDQIFPTEEEMQAGDERLAALQKKQIIKRVPKGTSAYQAAWIVEEDLDEDDDELTDVDAAGSDEDDRMSMFSYRGSDREGESDEDSDEYEDMVMNADDTKGYDDMVDYNEDAEAQQKLKMKKENAEDLDFPDEIDTPTDVAARIRFQKFRGLQSFRNSPWDTKESLPVDYSRIFQFENLKLTQKRVLKSVGEGLEVGLYVTIYLSDFPADAMEILNKTHPLILIGLLKHESKFSVLNMSIKRHQSNEEPIVSKEPLIYVTPMRKFQAGGVFSQHTRGDKHKLESFLHQARPTVATVYAPVQFNPCPVLVFKKDHEGIRLVATGSVLSVDPDRVVLKKYVLAGFPFKINVRSAVVRFMFYNR
eukprot:Ihof_evm3s67 gene=Ihof_evmTU3s67